MDWDGPSPSASRREFHYRDRIVSCFVDQPSSVDAMIAAAAKAHPDREAMVCGDRRWTWMDVDRDVGRIVRTFSTFGVRAGDRVALLVGNRAEFVLALYAAFRLGAIAVPLSTRYQTPEINYALNDCGAVLLVHDAELAGRLPPPDELPALRARISVGGAVGAESWSALLSGDALSVAPPAGEEDTAVILYTSGTTGHPKGAMLSHLGLVNSSLVFVRCFALTSEDRSIAAVPLAHVTGLVANVLAMAACGGALVILPAFKAQVFMALAARERTTHTIIVPAMYSLCLMAPDFESYDLRAWRIGGFGGAPMPEPVIQALAEKLPRLQLMNAYGATETSSPATIMPAGQTMARLASVGLPVPNCEIIVVDDFGREVPRGAPGELWIAGPSVVKGYWNRPEETVESFSGGWWHSGDIGMIDTEGFVHVLDRKKDMINRGGLKIFSAEVESVLTGHPLVLESAVVAKPCPVLGERVHAFVTARDANLTEAELKSFLATRLADYKVPESITLSTEPLLRNSNGKVLKRELRSGLLRPTPRPTASGSSMRPPTC